MSVTIIVDGTKMEINCDETITMSNGVKFDICKNGAISNVKLTEGITEFEVPEGVIKIAPFAFARCKSLKSITIPSSVTSIGFRAFVRCISLKSVIIEEGVTIIGEAAFRGCTSLESITIPEGVTSIGLGAFCRCTSLTSITIPEGVTSIGQSAFSGCTSLTSITIPEGVTSIGPDAFVRCTKLKSIIIPSSVTSIGDGIFSDCTSLETITIPSSVTSIGDLAFYGCISLESITIPEGVESIGDFAFFGCTSLESITIPEGVTNISPGAFYGCTSLESITIPSSVASIGDNVFRGCDQLGIIICDSQAMAEELNNNKLKYFGKADATTVAFANNDNDSLINAIWQKINSINEDDKAKLQQVLGDLSKISFKEKVLIYKCLREGSFNYEEFYQEFMQLADSESGWSKAFANLRNRVISNYGCESQKELVNIKGRVPDALLTNFLRRNELAALAITSQSGLQGVTVPTTGKTEPVENKKYTLDLNLKKCKHLVSVTIPHHYTDVSIDEFKDLPANSKLCKIKCYDDKIFTKLTSTDNKVKYEKPPGNIEVCLIDRSNERHIIKTASIKVSYEKTEDPTEPPSKRLRLG